MGLFSFMKPSRSYASNTSFSYAPDSTYPLPLPSVPQRPASRASVTYPDARQQQWSHVVPAEGRSKSRRKAASEIGFPTAGGSSSRRKGTVSTAGSVIGVERGSHREGSTPKFKDPKGASAKYYAEQKLAQETVESWKKPSTLGPGLGLSSSASNIGVGERSSRSGSMRRKGISSSWSDVGTPTGPAANAQTSYFPVASSSASPSVSRAGSVISKRERQRQANVLQSKAQHLSPRDLAPPPPHSLSSSTSSPSNLAIPNDGSLMHSAKKATAKRLRSLPSAPSTSSSSSIVPRSSISDSRSSNASSSVYIAGGSVQPLQQIPEEDHRPQLSPPLETEFTASRDTLLPPPSRKMVDQVQGQLTPPHSDLESSKSPILEHRSINPIALEKPAASVNLTQSAPETPPISPVAQPNAALAPAAPPPVNPTTLPVTAEELIAQSRSRASTITQTPLSPTSASEDSNNGSVEEDPVTPMQAKQDPLNNHPAGSLAPHALAIQPPTPLHDLDHTSFEKTMSESSPSSPTKGRESHPPVSPSASFSCPSLPSVPPPPPLDPDSPHYLKWDPTIQRWTMVLEPPPSVRPGSRSPSRAGSVISDGSGYSQLSYAYGSRRPSLPSTLPPRTSRPASPASQGLSSGRMSIDPAFSLPTSTLTFLPEASEPVAPSVLSRASSARERPASMYSRYRSAISPSSSRAPSINGDRRSLNGDRLGSVNEMLIRPNAIDTISSRGDPVPLLGADGLDKSSTSGYTSLVLPTGAYKKSDPLKEKLDPRVLGMPHATMASITLASAKGQDLPKHLQNDVPPPVTFSSHQNPPKKVADSEVLIHVYAVALDSFDSDLVREKSLAGSGIGKWVPGRAFVGRALEVGVDVRVIVKGDLVMGVVDVKKSGALAEYLVCDRRRLARIPVGSTLSLEQLACLPLLGVTAHRSCIGVGRGSRALILNAHEGVGALATQELSSIGAYVTAQVPRDVVSAEDDAWDNGAKEVISDDPVVMINGQHESGFDFVLDTVGGRRVYDASRRVIRTGGSFVTIFGEDHSVKPQVKSGFHALRRAFVKKDRKNINYIRHFPGGAEIDPSGLDTRDVLELPIMGMYVPKVGMVVPFERSSDAFEELATLVSGRHREESGSIVVRLTN